MRCNVAKKRKLSRKREKERGRKKKRFHLFDLKPTESSSHKEIRYIVLEERRNDEGQRPISNYIPPPREEIKPGRARAERITSNDIPLCRS